MASGGREPSDFSSDEEILHSLKKRLKKPKAIVSSDTDSDSDIDFGIKHKKTLQPLKWESDEDTNTSFRHDDNSSSSCVSSDNEQTDKCAICLSKFSGQDIATPEGCDHTFCLLCLQEWAKNNNTCPIDRLKFNLILIRHHNEKKICKRIFINCSESDWLSDSESEETPVPTETSPCAFCGFSEDVETLQICRECDKSFHTHCLMHPPSARICPSCAFYISLSFFKSSRERMNLHVRLSESRPDYQDYAREVCRVRQIQNIIRRLHEGRSMSASDTTSDEDTQHDGYSSVRYENGTRSQYPLIQKRRRAIRRFQNQALVSTAISATSNPELYSAYSDEEINDTRHENCNNNNRLSGPSDSSRNASSAYSRSTGDASTNPENFDIVGSILQSQALLHNSDVLRLGRDGAVFPNSNLNPNTKLNSASSSHDKSKQDAMPSFSQSRLILPCMDGAVYKQSPLNPTQNSNAKYQETHRDNYTCTSSSSSSKGPSLEYDNVNISSGNTFTNSGNDRYNNDNSCSSMNHKSFCNSVAEDIKKVSNFKESNKAHSEDEVDIYSDIESVGDDDGACNTIEGVGDRIEPMEMSFKDNSPSSNPDPGSDSSDNELVIDEDMAVDEENENRKENIQINNSKNKCETLENEHINESEESNISFPGNFNQEQSSRMHEVQDNGSYIDSHSAEDSHLNEESSQGTFQSSYHGKYRNDSEYDESKHGSEYEEVKNESEYDESRHGSEYEESKNEFESREVKNRSDDEDEDINTIENEDKDSIIVNENRNTSEYDDQESDMDVQVFEENSIDSLKKSTRAETSTPCSTLSSPKQYDEEMKLDNGDSQCDNSISGRMQELYDVESRKYAETTDVSFVQANENTSGSFSQVEDNENYQNENNSNFSFASSQNVMSEVEEGLDSNIDVSSQTFSEGDKPDINMDNTVNVKSEEYEDDDGELNENIDYSENASTPCLDENIDGQIEDSPIHSDIADSADLDIKSNVKDVDSKICRISCSNDECEMVENEYINSYKIENKHEISEKTSELAVDLGIEDISEAGSGDLDDDFADENASFSESKKLENTEGENNSKFDDNSNQQESKLISKHLEVSHNSNQSFDDREEGEIVEEKPVRRIDRKRTEKREHYHDENEDYNDVAPRVNISDLPRIPKIKRDREKDTSPLDLPIETKRTSVLGRVDLGGGDISWKRLSKHTRDRSYRDGRPKDERVLYRERESRKKEKKFADTEWRSDSKSRRRDEKKQDSEKIKTEYEPRLRKSDKKDNKISDWDYSERDKRSKSHKDKHKDKHKEKKDKGKHDKNKHSKDETKYSRDRSKDEDHYERELKIDKEQRFERVVYERGKCKDKDHKSKHKDRKSDSKPGKEHSREKHKHIHVSDHFSEKQREREVRKIDDKLKIVVEQKDSRKEKSKHKEKKETKHEKKSIHHHEHRKKEVERTPYTELASIESKEIFAKGDSIIINVSFNRASSPKDTNNDNIDTNVKDGKNIEDFEMDEVIIANDKGKKHALTDKGKNNLDTSVTKRPVTPPERTIPVLSVSESYWQGGDDSDANESQVSEKSVVEIPNIEEENDTMESVEPVGDNFSNSCNSTDEPETESAVKEIISGNEESPEKTDKVDNSFVKEPETVTVPAKRRSPRSPSPPSPADNDSYDPCEPTRSPSPPPIPIAPPLPVCNPKPPPSPELPPLPPEPEPVDIVLEETVCNKPSEFAVSSVVTSNSQTISDNTQVSIANSISMPSMLLPPPSFLSHTSTTTSSLPSLSSLIPPSNFNFQVNSHPNVIFQPNHVQQVIRGIVPTQIHTATSIPPPPNPPSLPHMGSVPPPPPPPSAMGLMSQVRHPQINVRPTLTPNSLLQNLTMGHPVTMAQMQLTHLHMPPNLSNAISSHQSPMMMPSQNQSLNLPVSIHNQPVTRVVLSQNQVINHSVMVQNQNLVSKPQESILSHQNLSNNNSQKSDKVTPEKTEVIDMEVDSPYSPGDSPSMDSVCDYSPTCSPLTSPSKAKDIFDSLLPTDHRTSGRRTQDILGKAEKSKRSDSKSDTPNKKSKHEHKRHSVRMQLADKTKNRREQRIEKKLDDSQLKILDELPSSAVEMQVKEKFLKKLNRQERVVEEVKLVLKPYYKSRDVNKEEYKDILRKSVPKICHNKSGEINPVKVKALVESYIKKIKHSRKKSDKKKSKLS